MTRPTSVHAALHHRSLFDSPPLPSRSCCHACCLLPAPSSQAAPGTATPVPSSQPPKRSLIGIGTRITPRSFEPCFERRFAEKQSESRDAPPPLGQVRQSENLVTELPHTPAADASVRGSYLCYVIAAGEGNFHGHTVSTVQYQMRSSDALVHGRSVDSLCDCVML